MLVKDVTGTSFNVADVSSSDSDTEVLRSYHQGQKTDTGKEMELTQTFIARNRAFNDKSRFVCPGTANFPL